MRRVEEGREIHRPGDWPQILWGPRGDASRIDAPSDDRSSGKWVDLFREVEASLTEDPASEKAQALAFRWTVLKGIAGSRKDHAATR